MTTTLLTLDTLFIGALVSLYSVAWCVGPFTASAFALIGPNACYTGVHAQAEFCAPKLYVRKMCVCFVSNHSATILSSEKQPLSLAISIPPILPIHLAYQFTVLV